jgi:hypothetical protein
MNRTYETTIHVINFYQCSLNHHSLFYPHALNMLYLQYSEYGWVLFNNDLTSQRPSLSAKYLICWYDMLLIIISKLQKTPVAYLTAQWKNCHFVVLH